MAKRDVTAAAAFGAAVRPDVRPMTAGMAAACHARATSERAVLDARSSRPEATVADLASRPSFGRSTMGLRSRGRTVSAWSIAVPAGARVGAGCPTARP
jgi:hypothetical protein